MKLQQTYLTGKLNRYSRPQGFDKTHKPLREEENFPLVSFQETFHLHKPQVNYFILRNIVTNNTYIFI